MLTYQKGNLFDFIDEEDRSIIICHCVNNLRIAASGFVVPLFNKYPEARTSYLKSKQELGHVDFSLVDRRYPKKGNIWVANMFGQLGISSKSTGTANRVKKPIKYSALVKCMEIVKENALNFQANKRGKITIMSPMFGSERAGGSWPLIEELIEEIWEDLDVTIFEL